MYNRITAYEGLPEDDSYGRWAPVSFLSYTEEVRPGETFAVAITRISRSLLARGFDRPHGIQIMLAQDEDGSGLDLATVAMAESDGNGNLLKVEG